MKIPDVNVLVGAFRSDSPHHVASREWLQRTLDSGEMIGVTSAVAAGVVRVATHRRIFREPSATDEVLGFLEAILSAPNVVRVDPGPRHWELFAALCRDHGARGNLVSDISHAATTIEHGAVWVSFDRDFARFSTLRWEIPGIT